MSTPKVFESEYRFCLILWENEPVKSMTLVKLCKERLGWSKATTYTVIKRLCERGVIKSEDAVVVTLVHFWDDLKKLCPCCKCKETEELAEEDFEDLAE